MLRGPGNTQGPVKGLDSILEIRASMETSLHTYLHQVEAVQHNLYYSITVWLRVITKDMENKINSFGTSCYRIMLNIKRIDRVPNATIYNRTETAPLIERVRLRQLRFLGHVLRLPENEPVREFAMYVPDSLLNDNQLLEMAQDCHRWRKLVVDCSAAEG